MYPYFIIIFFLLVAAPAGAWTTHLTGDAFSPETLLVVDKSKQNFLIFYNKSPLEKKHSWQCTTGQAHGDKFIEGDLRTPEGIYFLERRIAGRHLPFDLYGELAFTLNYPNPIDRINKKTGHSIWIHGRGKEVVPYDTEGCVAMDMHYMLALENYVSLQKTPVIITDSVSWEPAETASEESRRIVEKSMKWAAQWQARSDMYFSFYEPALFARSSGQSFNRFRSHKKRLFRQYDWMDVYIEYPKVLKGPGYWVSYFGQIFNAPGFYSAGVKRLYWKQNDSGYFRIVGEEWRSYPEKYLEQKYIASRKSYLREELERWRKSWLNADLESYMSFYHQDAVQNELRGASSIAAQKKDIWGRGLLPDAIDMGNIRVSSTSAGFEVSFTQRYSSVSGYSDYGLKTMVMAPFSDQWLIQSEDWQEIK